MNEVEIGGQLVPQQSFEAIANISSNKTLLVQKLTSKPAKPEITKGLKTIDEVFQHFNPKVEVEFETADGAPKKEELSFTNLGDFGRQGLVSQSSFLQDLQSQKDTYQSILKQLKSNKILKSALGSPDAKDAYLNALKAMIDEIESASQ
jgi:hypothetical protein